MAILKNVHIPETAINLDGLGEVNIPLTYYDHLKDKSQKLDRIIQALKHDAELGYDGDITFDRYGDLRHVFKALFPEIEQSLKRTLEEEQAKKEKAKKEKAEEEKESEE